jgi:hypothetical protein
MTKAENILPNENNLDQLKKKLKKALKLMQSINMNGKLLRRT